YARVRNKADPYGAPDPGCGRVRLYRHATEREEPRAALRSRVAPSQRLVPCDQFSSLFTLLCSLALHRVHHPAVSTRHQWAVRQQAWRHRVAVSSRRSATQESTDRCGRRRGSPIAELVSKTPRPWHSAAACALSPTSSTCPLQPLVALGSTP